MSQTLKTFCQLAPLELGTMRYRSPRQELVWDVLLGLCRWWGVATAIGLWGVGVEIAYVGHALGIYLLFAAVLTTGFESLYFINVWAKLCMRVDRHPLFDCIETLSWVDNWKRSILYVILAIGCFVKPKIWMAVIPGVMLVVCSMLYGVKSYRSRWEERISQSQEESYARFDDQMDIDDDDDEPEPVLNEIYIDTDARRQDDDTLANQNEIVDV